MDKMKSCFIVEALGGQQQLQIDKAEEEKTGKRANKKIRNASLNNKIRARTCGHDSGTVTMADKNNS